MKALSNFSNFRDDWHLTPAVVAGDLVFLSGVTGCKPDYTVSSDPETQFRNAFEFLEYALKDADLQFASIVEMTTYHVDLRKHLKAFRKVKDDFVRPPYPAWSCIGTTELITEGTLLEIRVICLRA